MPRSAAIVARDQRILAGHRAGATILDLTLAEGVDPAVVRSILRDAGVVPGRIRPPAPDLAADCLTDPAWLRAQYATKSAAQTGHAARSRRWHMRSGPGPRPKSRRRRGARSGQPRWWGGMRPASPRRRQPRRSNRTRCLFGPGWMDTDPSIRRNDRGAARWMESKAGSLATAGLASDAS